MALKRFVMSEGSEGSLSALSSLQNREVIAVGEGVEVPVWLMVDKLEESHLPSSENSSYSADWHMGLEDPYFVDMKIDNWRRQGNKISD